MWKSLPHSSQKLAFSATPFLHFRAVYVGENNGGSCTSDVEGEADMY